MVYFDVSFAGDDNKFETTFGNIIQGPKGDIGPEGPQGPQGPQGPKGEQGLPGASYDDTDLSNRVTTLEETVGTLNDSLEGVLNGN